MTGVQTCALPILIAQFIFSLITGEDNINLRKFGHSLSIYIFDTLKFLTYASEEKPFPFADWPLADQSHNETNSEG